ncbi:hypothetical protein FCJ61_05880 [Burkholderia metallica]|uniref:hypothetical protein n=1 Tax=Burkholderia metallica TaxID=488729 RepID=UPI00157B66DF|nr:hypothetical protein [Burkholderia metallica]NTZ82543.1 hypothetical protein [Burkholderia metallica]
MNFISNELALADEADHAQLRNLGALLTNLSVLISWIERSSIGEYSWPFVEELKKIAYAICTENTIDNPSTPPKVHVLSEGGVARYAIAAEQKRPFPSKRRILTVIFPRSLKHFVLLHSLLGHELGHAIWRGSEHEMSLKAIVQNELINPGGPLHSPQSAAAWLYSPNAPQPIKDDLADLAKRRNITQANFFGGYAAWHAWIEEITCDIIGLLTFGPSFVAAATQALYGVAPSGGGFGPEHPPVGCRINFIISAVQLLKMDQFTLPNAASNALCQKFWEEIKSKRQLDPWYDVFPSVQIGNSVNGISALLSSHQPSHYPAADPLRMSRLVSQLISNVPPVGYVFGGKGEPRCERVDFRHVLYAGWIVAAGQSADSFFTLNRLCEHGIMQQHAIDIHTQQ